MIAALMAENDKLRAALAEQGYWELNETKAGGLVLAEPEVRPGAPITLTYTNWRGDTEVRRIIPRRVWLGSTEWHPEPQWLLAAFDMDKQADRDFALKDFGQPVQSFAKNTSDARSVILEIIGWAHMIEWTGGYPDWMGRAKQAVGMFDGGAE